MDLGVEELLDIEALPEGVDDAVHLEHLHRVAEVLLQGEEGGEGPPKPVSMIPVNACPPPPPQPAKKIGQKS